MRQFDAPDLLDLTMIISGCPGLPLDAGGKLAPLVNLVLEILCRQRSESAFRTLPGTDAVQMI